MSLPTYDLPTYISMFSNVMLSAAAIFTAASVWRWRKDQVWKRRVELAEELIEDANRAFSVVNFMRYSSSFASETAELNQKEGESDEEFEVRKSYSVAWVRFNKEREVFSRLSSHAYRAELIFDKELAEKAREFIRAQRQVNGAANSLSLIALHDLKNRQLGRDRKPAISDEAFQALERTLWGTESENDEIYSRLLSARDYIERRLKELL